MYLDLRLEIMQFFGCHVSLWPYVFISIKLLGLKAMIAVTLKTLKLLYYSRILVSAVSNTIVSVLMHGICFLLFTFYFY